MKFRIRSWISLITILLFPGAGWADRIIQWGPSSNIVSGFTDFPVGRNDLTLDLTAYSNPTIGPNYYPDNTLRSPAFVANTLGLINGAPGGHALRISPADPRDRLWASTSSSGNETEIRSLWMWTKTGDAGAYGFLNGGDTAPAVNLTGMHVDTGSNGGSASPRFVIQLDNSDFYISESGSNGGFGFTNATDLAWFDYDPVNNFTNLLGGAASLSSGDFDNLTAAGVYMQKLGGPFNQTYIHEFMVDATVVPEARTLLLALCGLALSAAIRRHTGPRPPSLTSSSNPG